MTSTLNRLVTSKVIYMGKNAGMFSSKTLISWHLGWHGDE